MYKFSFIIPMYNEQEDVPRTIESCLVQVSESSYEIMLVDDGSTDDTLSICQRYEEHTSRIKIIHYDQNRGVSYARNRGVEESTGDIVIFLNADEIVASDFIKKLEGYYSGGADYVFPQTRVINTEYVYPRFRDAYRLYKYPRPNDFMWSQGFSCRKSIFNEVKGFDESYPGCGGEDWDLVSRIDRLGKNRVVACDITVRHAIPYKARDVIWHMYNRGRGSLNYDLIYRHRSSAKIWLKPVINVTFLIFIGLLKWQVLLLVLIYLLLKQIRKGYSVSKYTDSKRIQIIAMYCIYRIVRCTGYYASSIRRN